MCTAKNAQNALQQIRDVHKTQIHNVFATNTQCAQDTNTQYVLHKYTQCALQDVHCKCKFATLIVSTNRYN